MSDETKLTERSDGLEREVRALRIVLERFYSLMRFVVAVLCVAVLTWLFVKFIDSRPFKIISVNGESVENEK